MDVCIASLLAAAPAPALSPETALSPESAAPDALPLLAPAASPTDGTAESVLLSAPSPTDGYSQEGASAPLASASPPEGVAQAPAPQAATGEVFPEGTADFARVPASPAEGTHSGTRQGSALERLREAVPEGTTEGLQGMPPQGAIGLSSGDVPRQGSTPGAVLRYPEFAGDTYPEGREPEVYPAMGFPPQTAPASAPDVMLGGYPPEAAREPALGRAFQGLTAEGGAAPATLPHPPDGYLPGYLPDNRGVPRGADLDHNAALASQELLVDWANGLFMKFIILTGRTRRMDSRFLFYKNVVPNGRTTLESNEGPRGARLEPQ